MSENKIAGKISGIVPVYKRVGVGSTDVVRQIKKMLPKGTKIGHAGTLDPFAEGVLVVCIGEATKLSEYLMQSKKAYLATLRLGKGTDTLDNTGSVIEENPVPENLLDEDFNVIASKYIGRIFQKVPDYSAIKINGKRSYDYAREGIEVDRPEKEIEIFSIKLKKTALPMIEFSVECGGGVYIRQLALDIAHDLGSTGHLTRLIRTYASGISLDTAKEFSHTFEQALKIPSSSLKMITVSEVVELLWAKQNKVFSVSNETKRNIQHGKHEILEEDPALKTFLAASNALEPVFLVDPNKNLVAVVEKESFVWRIKRGYNL